MSSLTVASAEAMSPNGIKKATHLVATPAIVQVNPSGGGTAEMFNLMATLTLQSNGKPLDDEKVTFYADGHKLGSALTNAQGVATLSVESNVADRIDIILARGYTATFAGTSKYAPSSASAGIVQTG
jgi:hypothetical protein